MARNLITTGLTILDVMDDTIIANGSAAMIDDLAAADRNQFALFYRFGSPPMWMSVRSEADQVTIEYRVPPGVEYVVIHALGAGGALVTNSGNAIEKRAVDMTITTDQDANGATLSWRTKPHDITALYTSLEDAEYNATTAVYKDSITAVKQNRLVRVAANATATAWANCTIRFNIPSDLHIYGIGIEPVWRHLV